jgi:hypothetical protein
MPCRGRRLDGGALEVIGDEGNGLTCVTLDKDAAQWDVELGVALTGKLHFDILDDPEAIADDLADVSGFCGFERDAGLRSGDEKSLGFIDTYPPIETAVPLVEDIGRTRLDRGGPRQ